MRDERASNQMTPPRLKVCCIQTVEEARLAVAHGAAAVGLVSKMPSGPGMISESRISSIARTIPPSVGSFLLTSARRVVEIIAQQRRCRVNTLQLVDRLDEGTYDDFREALPGISIVQAIHVVGEESLDEACDVARRGVDGLLLDSGNVRLPVKELGGTGRVHDWRISRQIVEAVGIPVFLAGGLRPDNVAEAIRQVRPFGVDVCSGLRTDGKLDESKLSAFIRSLRSVDDRA
ncbi:N-(5'-phosphoribosyl)anthranilate isomerase [Planctomycetes bacterium Pan216]|uniref:N-(5'-phosphoribosyl)anthranilate isomerase n=1 Tax=Kolteria novifilia TaxID=2527975 RepID=A0A518B8L9_9BACT|nr:N-(5'-phosphoribosyl)anthranilate isomerase [Planctomycetes bacterium Pan216]